MAKLQKFEDFLNEALPTKEINPREFPDPFKGDEGEFFIKGKQDGSAHDDVVYTKEVGIPAKSLKASQDAVYLGKALSMAIGGVEGGDLQAVISKDNRILDGHHRWAATIFNNPNAKVEGLRADLNIGDLIPVLRAAGDALGNKRGLPPEGGDISIFVATLDDVKKCVYEGEWMDKKYFDKEKAIKWFEKQGDHKVQNALMLIKRNGPPAGAPPRADMPKIKPDQVSTVGKILSAGKIDIRDPYTTESTFMKFSTFVNENNQNTDDTVDGTQLDRAKAELKKKLNDSKFEIKSLKKQGNGYQADVETEDGLMDFGFDKNFKIQRTGLKQK